MNGKLCHLVLAAALALLPGCAESVPWMAIYGFHALNPPSNLYQAGGIVAIEWTENDGKKTISQLKLICGPRASLGAHWMPQVSSTLTSSVKKTEKYRWQMEGDAWARVKSDSSLSRVKNVEVVLSNARIAELSDIDIFENIANRTPECRAAIAARIKQGFVVSMISSNIIADISYNVEFEQETNISKEAKHEMLHNIAMKFGGGHTMIDSKSIHATNLAVGVKTDQYLLAISTSQDCADKMAKVHEPTMESASVDTTMPPDAPVVPPAGGMVAPVRGPN